MRRATPRGRFCYLDNIISIHALLAESDYGPILTIIYLTLFLSTLSLRRATMIHPRSCSVKLNFYPRSPCGERLFLVAPGYKSFRFLSTLSLRRATVNGDVLSSCFGNFYPRSPCGERPYDGLIASANFCHFYPRSPCGERHTWARGSRVTYVISIHALLAESDFLPISRGFIGG